MLVKDLMTKSVITVKPEMLISEVAELLQKNHFTGVPVVSADGVVLGTISERDFITADSNLYLPTYIKLLSGMDYLQGSGKQLPHVVDQIVHATAKEIMNTEVPFAHPEMTLEQLAVIFAEKRVNPVPVTDDSNRIVGIISRSDLIKFFSPSQVKTAYVPDHLHNRPIDKEVEFLSKRFSSSFAVIAKARANIWLTTAIVLFVVGFLAGIIYVADPNIFVKEAPSKTTVPTSRLPRNIQEIQIDNPIPESPPATPESSAPPASSAPPTKAPVLTAPPSPKVSVPSSVTSGNSEPSDNFEEIDSFLNKFDNP